MTNDNPFGKSAAAKEKPTIASPKGEGAAAPAAPSDPFASPSGVSGEYITTFIDRLMLVKPTEYIPEMNTNKGKNDAVRIDLALLDDADEPGRVVTGVLLFQTALKREAKAVLDSPSPYLLGRLIKTTTGGGNTLYLFEEGTDEDKALARQFLAAATL